MLACAAFGLAGTIGFAATHTCREWRPAPSHEGPHGSPLRHATLVRVFVPTLACGVPVGALAIVAAAYAAQHGSTSITGWALAANAAGALAAGLYGAVRPGGRTGSAALTVAGLALAAGYLPLAIPLPVAVWIPLCTLAGVALPVVLSLVFQRVQLLCPPNLLTEANAWVVTSFGLGAAVAALLAGIATDRLDEAAAVPAVVIAGALVTAVVCALSYRPDPT